MPIQDSQFLGKHTGLVFGVYHIVEGEIPTESSLYGALKYRLLSSYYAYGFYTTVNYQEFPPHYWLRKYSAALYAVILHSCISLLSTYPCRPCLADNKVA
jgi:hypothetical protein